ncbi:MAG: insulinase family protein [Candidatus Scalindua sp.]|nr:insulinase family protein [Candidatus Scalindua sp.]
MFIGITTQYTVVMKKISLLLCIVLILSCTGFQKKEFGIRYEKFTLENGLEVILHEDHSDPIVAVATLIHVGSSREKLGKTGFAHFFEHMAFHDSENVPIGANRKLITEWGGARNGGTWSDGTIYYEVVPKDVFEKILWIDSDRLGFMINTVTEEALEREKQVVKNEKRERVDNVPYGHTNQIIRSNLYPPEHPYNWTVIGSLPDLQAATIDDVKEFYEQYYGAGNASLVIAGDIEITRTKELVQKWFGEIRKGPDVEPIKPMPVHLEKSKILYFEDNFATLPELHMEFPSVEEYHEDTYALGILGNLLGGSRRSPLYKIIVKERKLAPSISAYQSSSEIAGKFVFRVRADSDKDLDEVKAAIEEGLQRFEEEGFTDNELVKIKAKLETDLIQSVETVLDKAFTLIQDNEFKGDPGYIVEAARKTQSVTREDIMRVYQKYIKGKNYVMTNLVPKGKCILAVEGAEQASVWIEKVKPGIAHEIVGKGEEAHYEKTITRFDRSEPDFGELPLFKMPEIWTDRLDNGLRVYGIENNEIPLVVFTITLNGGHVLDPEGKSGVAELTAKLMMEGTVNRTSADLEEAIGMLGAEIEISSSYEETTITAKCLSRHFKATVALVEEIILEPRWDEAQYARLKREMVTKLKDREAEPRTIALLNFNTLVFGDKHIFSRPVSGILESAAHITLEDLKNYYNTLSPQEASFLISGAVTKDEVLKALRSLNKEWKVNVQYELPEYEIPKLAKGGIYFTDVPGSKQSVIFVGKLTVPGTDRNFNKLKYANEILGSVSSGTLTQILRHEKGYTYGAYSFLRETKEIVPFIAYSSVRSNATLASLKIFKEIIENYGHNFSENDVEITKNKILKRNTRAYESLSAKLDILHNISKYGYSLSYIEDAQNELMNMTLKDFKEVIARYLKEEEMIYLVVGDAATQLEEVNKLGKGNAILLDIYGNQRQQEVIENLQSAL